MFELFLVFFLLVFGISFLWIPFNIMRIRDILEEINKKLNDS